MADCYSFSGNYSIPGPDMGDTTLANHLQRLARVEVSIGHMEGTLLKIEAALGEINARHAAALQRMTDQQASLASEVRSLGTTVAEQRTVQRAVAWVLAGVGLPLVIAVVPVLVEHHLDQPRLEARQ